MKRIEFIAPVEAMRGNLSGKQELKYAENENPAYEAPNGAQSAHNYQPRFIGAKRAASGLKYFAVRTKQTAVLNGKTRMQMALTGAIAAIRSAVMALPVAGSGRTPWETIQAAYAYYKNENPDERDAKSLLAFFDARVRTMLMYKRTSIEFNAHPGGYTLNNPFAVESSSALQIKLSIWVKFADLFAFSQDGSGCGVFFIDGRRFLAPEVGQTSVTGLPEWTELKAYTNPNLVASVASITIESSAVKYQGLPLYKGSNAVNAADAIVPDFKYLTIQA